MTEPSPVVPEWDRLGIPVDDEAEPLDADEPLIQNESDE